MPVAPEVPASRPPCGQGKENAVPWVSCGTKEVTVLHLLSHPALQASCTLGLLLHSVPFSRTSKHLDHTVVLELGSEVSREGSCLGGLVPEQQCSEVGLWGVTGLRELCPHGGLIHLRFTVDSSEMLGTVGGGV